MTCSVYWIRHPDHTDMFTQGYIGISSNVKQRWESHSKNSSNLHIGRAVKKYGWDNLIKQVVLIADKAYCLAVETKLRPANQIGWNVVGGGGNPPSSLGKTFIRSEEYCKKQSAAKTGHRHTPEVEAHVTKNLLIHGVPTRFVKGQVPHNKGVPALPHVIERLKKANTGSKHTQEHKDKISASNMGRIMNEYTKQKLREANIGREPAMKGKHFPKVECPHCAITGGIIPMKRWHFNNCKLKEVA